MANEQEQTSMPQKSHMTKQEVSELLGVTPRQIEKYVEARRLSVEYIKTSKGRAALYRRDEVEALKQKIEQVNSSKAALYTVPSSLPASNNLPAIPEANNVPEVTTAALVQLLSAFDTKRAAAGTVSIAEKLLLTLEEAQALTGLSRDTLREAVRTGALAARVIGRAWRIKRADLENYVQAL